MVQNPPKYGTPVDVCSRQTAKAPSAAQSVSLAQGSPGAWGLMAPVQAPPMQTVGPSQTRHDPAPLPHRSPFWNEPEMQPDRAEQHPWQFVASQSAQALPSQSWPGSHAKQATPNSPQARGVSSTRHCPWASQQPRQFKTPQGAEPASVGATSLQAPDAQRWPAPQMTQDAPP